MGKRKKKPIDIRLNTRDLAIFWRLMDGKVYQLVDLSIWQKVTERAIQTSLWKIRQHGYTIKPVRGRSKIEGVTGVQMLEKRLSEFAF